MVFTPPVISKASCPWTNSSVTAARASITFSITVTFMSHSFFKVQVIILLFTFFNFTLWLARTAKSTIQQFFFLLIIIRSCRLAEIRWSVCISKSLRSLCVSISRTHSVLCIYYLFAWSNLNFLHNSQWNTLPTQLCVVLYFFCANLLHSFIIWLIVSSPIPHKPRFAVLLCLIYSRFDMTSLYGVFCSTIRRNSGPLLRFPFLSHVHVFSLFFIIINLLQTSFSHHLQQEVYHRNLCDSKSSRLQDSSHNSSRC